MRNVAGLSTTDAQKSSDMFAKCRYMDEITGQPGALSLPPARLFPNSMTELTPCSGISNMTGFEELGMAHFDCWASRFGRQ